MEEIDLCWRFHAMGYQTWSEPLSTVYHKNAVSLPMHSHRKYYLNHRNSLLMLLSNYSVLNTFYIGTIRIMLEFIALVYAILKLNLNHASGIIRSLLWILIHPITIISRRNHFKKLRKIKDKHILNKLFKGSIVFSHFISGNRTYSDMVSKAD